MVLTKNKRIIELLAPAGDFPSLHAAVDSGADAVYFGLKEFNMRNAAKNFEINDLKKIRAICGKHVKMYLTLNVVIYDGEQKKLEKLLLKIQGKVDAVICWDLSVIELCRRYKIPFHVSTQASVSNTAAALFYKKLGAERIVLARELDLKQIKKISKVIDVECFAHGAMCVSISGRCFISQFLCGKSANRGECHQYCRRAYHVRDENGNELKLEHDRVMSAKDLCTLPFLEKMKRAGIISFKLEGRNRPAEYVKTVVSVYRKGIDKKLTPEEIEEGLGKLRSVYNRGLSSGFYLGLPTADDFSTSEDGEAEERKLPLGKILYYYPKAGVAALLLQARDLHLGEEIYILGDKTGIVRTKVERIEVENKEIAEGKKGMTVGIKTGKCKKGDRVFIIEKKI